MKIPFRFPGCFALFAGLLLASVAAQTAALRFNGATPLQWPVKLADSGMARRGDRHFFGGSNPRVMFIRGFEGATIDNIRIRNSTFRGVAEAEVATHAGSIGFRNVTIEPAEQVRGLNSAGSPAGSRPEAPKNP